MVRFGMIAGVLLLSACATNVEQRIALPEEVKGSVLIASIETETPRFVPQHVEGKLEQAVRTELAKRTAGTREVNLKMTITRFEVSDKKSRFWAGAFAGKNYMDVVVRVTDGNGAELSEFTVKRESNPGGYGVFYDQEMATVEAAAEAIVKTLYGEP